MSVDLRPEEWDAIAHNVATHQELTDLIKDVLFDQPCDSMVAATFWRIAHSAYETYTGRGVDEPFEEEGLDDIAKGEAELYK